MANLSAQRVRSKTRTAVRRREDQIEQDEIESGELNLIPYLDMVTNLMLFLLFSISAGIIFTQIDTSLPDKAPPPSTTQPNPNQNPDDQPLKLFVSITRDRMILWSISGLEGTLDAPKATFPRTGRDGESCDGPYMCESNFCRNTTQKCEPSPAKDVPLPVFDYRGLSNALFEIANRRYAGKQRKADTYQIILMADGAIPYNTIASVMAAMRCKLPEFGKDTERLRAADRRPRAQEGEGPDLARQAPLRHGARHLRPEDDGAVQRHPLLVGVRMSFTQREARGLIRKAVNRVPEGESIRHLNIMPMMDMMTILLVAFIFQMATSATRAEAGTVELPRTTTDAPLPEKAWTLVITPTGIVVEGKSIVSVNNGDVDPSEKEGGSLGIKIPRLSNFLASLRQEEIKQLQRRESIPPRRRLPSS